LKKNLILSFHLIYRMLGIDSGITEKSGSKNSISEWRTFGMADTMRLGVEYFLCSLETVKKKSAAVNRFTVNIFDLRKTCSVVSFRGDSKL